MMPNSRRIKEDSTAVQLLRGVVEQNEVLRAALRKHGMVQRHQMAEGGTTVHVGWRCNVCEAEWDRGEKEIHFPKCPLTIGHG